MKLFALVLAAFVLSPALSAADPAPSSAKSAPAPAKKAPPAPAATTAPGETPGATAQKMASDFGKQRDDRLDQRKALLERLQTAKTEDEKQRILAELRQQQQARIDQQRELARQIREQMLARRGETLPATAATASAPKR